MLVTFLFAIFYVSSILSETPFLAYELADSISKCHKIDWVRMEDENNNIRYIITLHQIPDFAKCNFENTLLKQHLKKEDNNGK
jgi:hypothetical protein